MQIEAYNFDTNIKNHNDDDFITVYGIVSNFLRKINVDISNVIETTSYYPLSSLNICELLCLIKRFEAAW